MRAMVARVRRRTGAVHEVIAVDIVNEAVAIIIDPIARDLATVHPHVGSQVGMHVIHARINHRHYHLRRVHRPRHRACCQELHIRSRRPRRAVHTLSGVLQRPHVRKARVIRRGGGMAQVVRLHRLHVRVVLQVSDQRRLPRRNAPASSTASVRETNLRERFSRKTKCIRGNYDSMHPGTFTYPAPGTFVENGRAGQSCAVGVE